jgi:hypothetical protein
VSKRVFKAFCRQPKATKILYIPSIPGAAFTKCFYNSSTIIPSSILPQVNPDAPNSSKGGKIVEELWKNCRIIWCMPNLGKDLAYCG